MNNFYDPSFRTSLAEPKNSEKKPSPGALKNYMQIIFILSFLSLIFLAFAKANGI